MGNTHTAEPCLALPADKFKGSLDEISASLVAAVNVLFKKDHRFKPTMTKGFGECASGEINMDAHIANQFRAEFDDVPVITRNTGETYIVDHQNEAFSQRPPGEYMDQEIMILEKRDGHVYLCHYVGNAGDSWSGNAFMYIATSFASLGGHTLQSAIEYSNKFLGLDPAGVVYKWED